MDLRSALCQDLMCNLLTDTISYFLQSIKVVGESPHINLSPSLPLLLVFKALLDAQGFVLLDIRPFIAIA